MWRALVGLLVGAVLGMAAFVAVARPQIVTEPTLPRTTTVAHTKPLLPRLLLRDPDTKPAAVALFADGAAPTPQPPADGAVTAPPSTLATRIDAAVAEAAVTGTVAVLVLDAAGEVVYDLNGGVPLVPASTAKLVTAAAALTGLGPDHRFTTSLAVTAEPGVDGVLRGDLVLVGGGDPALASDVFASEVAPDRPATRLSALADAVVQAGIVRVEGRVVGDPTYLPHEPLAAGWPPRYLEDLDATPIGGLTVDAGRQLFLEGGALRSRAAPDPAAEAAAALVTALAERGVEVTGGPTSTAVRPAVVRVVAEVQSPPLVDLLAHVVQRSDNHMADTIFRVVGLLAEGEGTWADAAAQTRRLLAPLGLRWDGTVLADGSGLSRDSRISPGLLSSLNARMSASAVGATWQALMAVSGESGTLTNRLTGTIAELRLRGKTGSLRDARSLSGSVVGPAGEAYWFTVMTNDVEGEAVARSRRLQDLVVLELAADLYGCTREPVATPPPNATPATEPAELPPLPTYACG